MLLFIKKNIKTNASSADIIGDLKELTQQSASFNSFSENSFSFSMWEKRNHRMYSAIKFFGIIDEQDDECIIKYSIRPGAGFMFVLLIFIIPLLYALKLLIFSTVSYIFLALSIAFPLIIAIIIMSQETACNERLNRKIKELEDEKA